jgi:hypothetical protein
MSIFLSLISECLIGRTRPASSAIATVQIPFQVSEKTRRSDQEVANEILTLLFKAYKNNSDLELKLQSTVGTCGWKESIAERVLNGLKDAFKKGAPMGAAMRDAFERSVREGQDFARDHPIYFAVIALGVLVLLAPWALEALGFAELGPVEGESPVNLN